MRHWFMRGRLHIESFVCVCHTCIYICIRLIADKHLACDAGLCISALGFVEETTTAEPVRLSDPSAFGLFLHMSCPKPVDLFPRHGMYHSVALDFVDVRSDIMHLLQAAVWACGTGKAKFCGFQHPCRA